MDEFLIDSYFFVNIIEKKKKINSYHKLTKSRSINKRVIPSIHHSTIWQNLLHESTIGEGSGDALCVAILPDNKHARGYVYKYKYIYFYKLIN